MAIYIKGMGMPKYCDECRCICSRWNGNEMIWRCGLMLGEESESTDRDELYELCPLTEVPEPHGRLVDADALYKELVKESDYFINEMENQEKIPNEYVDNFRVYTSYILSGLTSAMISLHNAPTVIEGSE